MSAVTEIVNEEAISQAVLDPDKEYELVNGQLQEKAMAGARHGGVGTRLIIRLGGHVEARELGGVYGPDTTFTIGNNQRLPDISFVSAERIPEDGEPEGIWTIAPDLAIEVISLNDLYENVMNELWDYFAAGVRQVWLISTERKTLTIYTSPTQSTTLTENDELVNDDLLGGFRCHLSELFKNPVRR